MKKRHVVLAAASAAMASAATVFGISKFFEFTSKRPKDPRHSTDPDDTVSADYWKNSWQEERIYAGSLPQETWEIQSDDGLRLEATWIPAETDSRKTVICVHGYHSNRWREYATFVRFYHEMGLNILLPDNRAHGKSEGTIIGYGWLDRLDIEKWIRTVVEKQGDDSGIVLQGVSMGAATVLMASGDSLPKQVRAIVADCPYTSLEDEMTACIEAQKIPVEPLRTATSAYSKVVAGYSFKEASALEQVKKSITPTLFITGDQDTLVPTEMTHRLYEACPCEKEILVVSGARHAEAHVTGRELYEETVRNFLADKWND